MNEGTCRWISVEERLPKQDVYVLYADGNQSDCVWFYSSSRNSWGNYASGSFRNDGKHITHWLEAIPPPIPKRKVRGEIHVIPINIPGIPNLSEVRAYIDGKAENVKITYEVEQ